MSSYITRALKLPDLRNKILITFGVLALYRFLAHVPVPGVDIHALRALFDSNQLLNFFSFFTGGGLSNLSIISLGVGPYITASIMIQLLTMVVPSLEELSKEGAFGREKINQYTQALTVPLSIIQAYGIYFLIGRQEIGGLAIFPNMSGLDLLIIIATMSAGTFLLMWIANIITEYGVGNGTSIIIFAGILAGIPSGAAGLSTVTSGTQFLQILIFTAVALGVIGSVVYINEAFRKIEVQYSARATGNHMVGGGNSFIPVKINQAGVIPIIFAVSLVLLPNVVGGYLQKVASPVLSNIGIWITINFHQTAPLYILSYFLLVFGFTYFYTSITFNPEKIADDIRKGGGFIPGIRPGRSTIKYLSYIINRLTLAGGVFLGAIAILPSIIQRMTNISSLGIGGTGLLIVVSVVLESVKQIESQVITREYETFTG